MEKKRHVDFLTALCVGGIGLYAVLESRNISAKYYARPQHGNNLTSPALTPSKCTSSTGVPATPPHSTQKFTPMPP